jgi:hypothetical protein
MQVNLTKSTKKYNLKLKNGYIKAKLRNKQRTIKYFKKQGK